MSATIRQYARSGIPSQGGNPITGSTSFSVGPLGADTIAGNLLLCVVWGNMTCASTDHLIPSGLPVTAGIAWQELTHISISQDIYNGFSDTFGSLMLAVYYCTNAPALSASQVTTVNLTCSTTHTAGGEIKLFEMSGEGSSQLVGVRGSSGDGIRTTATTPVVPITITEANITIPAGCMAFCFLLNGGSLSGATGKFFSGVGTGWTQDELFGSVFYVEEAVSSSDTTLAGAFNGAQQSWVAIGLGFAPAAVNSFGCGDCPGPHLLELIPGFSDLPDSVLVADDPAFALHVGEIAFNATFGMVRCEVFPCVLKHGDTVPLPSSCWDGYKYSREELTYLWAVQSSLDPSTNWISGPDSLWFMNWNVNQTTGEVFSEEWYERSSTADSRLAAKSNDGSLIIFTIAQRQKTSMIMSAPASYTAINESIIATDRPYTQDLAQHLNQNAKFSCINSEVFYLGEYTNGQTVTLPISPVDGYVYSMAECKFQHAWRWTASGTTYIQPQGSDEQAAPFQASISVSGVVSITVKFSTNGGENVITENNFGRIAAFAFCTRSATPSSGTLANNFTELDLGFFFPGATVRASEVLTIKRNIDEAILSPEFFGPTDYADAATIPLPVSPVDGYSYTRDEVQYLWSWSDTNNSAPGNSHIRLPLFLGSIDPATGIVKLRTWRLPPGGPFLDDNNTFARIRVLTLATRQAIHPVVTPGNAEANTPADVGVANPDNSGFTVNGS
jgi:hypothetical protein